jgi:hydroxymethylbilane synthase
VLIASRGSELALWQARWVEGRVREAAPSAPVGIEVIRTTGDRVQDVPLSWIGDRGLFTKEIDAALLDGRADIAVHSLKDVPTRLADGLDLAAITEREDPRDVLLSRADLQARRIDDLPPGARIGTSSLRRRAQLSRLRPDLEIADLRGNLNTRLKRLDSGDYDGVLLAAAGVIRMGWRDRVSEWLDPARWLPAVGQGALAIVVRTGDEATRALVQRMHDPRTAAAVLAERAFLGALEGGCQVPIAALARVEREVVSIDGLVAGLDGSVVLRSSAAGPAERPAEVGRALARDLIDRGADRLLDEVRRSSAAPQVPAP